MKQVFKSVLLALAAATSLTSAALAESNRPADLRVAHGDLDLSQPGDAGVFKARVKGAVADWCADNAGLFSGTRGAGADSTCRAHAERLVAMSVPGEQRQALRLAAARTPGIQVAAR